MEKRQLHSSGVVQGTPYTCTIHRDCIDPSKTEEILCNLERLFSKLYGAKVTISKFR